MQFSPVPSTIESLYNEAVSICGIGETLDAIIAARSKLSAVNISLQKAISNYVASEDDVANRLAMVVYLANLTPGPVILFINAQIGYGLFADRDYNYKEELTTYGGVESSDFMTGDYVIEYGKHKFIDGKYNFKLSQKGRFVNEQHDRVQFKSTTQMTGYLRKFQNVKLVHDEKSLRFEPLANGLQKGEELIWYYGKDYERPWMTIGCLACNAPIVFVCSRCLNTMYCSDQCASEDWKRHAREECLQ